MAGFAQPDQGRGVSFPLRWLYGVSVLKTGAFVKEGRGKSSGVALFKNGYPIEPAQACLVILFLFSSFDCILLVCQGLLDNLGVWSL
jgi:hypothetical protein